MTAAKGLTSEAKVRNETRASLALWSLVVEMYFLLAVEEYFQCLPGVPRSNQSFSHCGRVNGCPMIGENAHTIDLRLKPAVGALVASGLCQ